MSYIEVLPPPAENSEQLNVSLRRTVALQQFYSASGHLLGMTKEVVISGWKHTHQNMAIHLVKSLSG